MQMYLLELRNIKYKAKLHQMWTSPTWSQSSEKNIEGQQNKAVINSSNLNTTHNMVSNQPMEKHLWNLQKL